MLYKVERGPSFETQLEEIRTGLPRFDERLEELIWQLERAPTTVGRQMSTRKSRYVVRLATGTVDWYALVDYFVYEDEQRVELLNIFAVGGP